MKIEETNELQNSLIISYIKEMKTILDHAPELNDDKVTLLRIKNLVDAAVSRIEWDEKNK